jgi:hypothetical protein
MAWACALAERSLAQGVPAVRAADGRGRHAMDRSGAIPLWFLGAGRDRAGALSAVQAVPTTELGWHGMVRFGQVRGRSARSGRSASAGSPAPTSRTRTILRDRAAGTPRARHTTAPCVRRSRRTTPGAFGRSSRTRCGTSGWTGSGRSSRRRARSWPGRRRSSACATRCLPTLPCGRRDRALFDLSPRSRRAPPPARPA